MSEFKIQIDREPDKSGSGKLAGAKAAKETVANEVRSRRAAIHARHKQDQSVMDADAERQRTPSGEAPPKREDIESIEVELPNGLTVEYGPPLGISLLDRLTRFYNDRDPTVAQHRLARILMCVRKINNKTIAPIIDEIDRTKLANRIGDEGIDLLMYYDRLYWPPLTQADLPQVKKNLRQP